MKFTSTTKSLLLTLLCSLSQIAFCDLAKMEVVVVDDCSPGNCADIVRAYGDSRIKYVRHDRNRSLLQARNSICLYASRISLL